MFNLSAHLASIHEFENAMRPCYYPPSIPYLESYLNDPRSGAHYPFWADPHVLLIDHLDRAGNSVYKTLVLAPHCVACSDYERSLPTCWRTVTKVLI